MVAKGGTREKALLTRKINAGGTGSDAPLSDIIMSLPIRVRKVPHKQGEPVSGRTHDISTAGIYFTVGREFPAGSELDFTLTLPAEITHGTEVSVRARAKVVRAEKKRENAERVGVAATIEKYHIIRTRCALS